MYVYLLVLTVVLYIVCFVGHASKKYMRAAISNLPGPYCVPLLGALHTIYKINHKNIFKISDKFKQKYGNVTRLWAFNRLIVISSDFELNEQLLFSNVHITKQRSYGILHQWLGVGLLLSDGKKWHSRRKIITPTFHFKILEEFLEVFDQQSSVTIHSLAAKADGVTAFDISPYMSLLTLDVIAETAMGTKVNAQTDTTMRYTSAVNEMTSLMAWRFLRVHCNNEIMFTLLYPHKKLRQMKLIRIMHEFTRNVIEKRRHTLENNLKSSNASRDDPSGTGTKKRMALLDVLLQATVDDKPLTDADIREEVETFMFEGHDTTTSALSFTLYLLARHPRVQNKLLAEVRQVYGDDNCTPFSLMNLNELKYMECVIKESLRLYPSVPFIGREIMEDFTYKHSRLGDGVIPAGTEFLMSFIGAMQDHTGCELSSSDFKPERYERSDVNNISNVIAFSAGPRNCIGQKFAMYEMKVILSKIIRQYELLPLGDDIELVLNMVLRSETGMQLGIRKRTL